MGGENKEGEREKRKKIINGISVAKARGRKKYGKHIDSINIEMLMEEDDDNDEDAEIFVCC